MTDENCSGDPCGRHCVEGGDLQQTRVSFKSGDLKLEGVLHMPDGAGPFPAVVVCHPHPLYGGSMDNNVVDAVCDALAQASIASFKFNFRGVGRSQGWYDEGRGEGQDVKAAIEYVAALREIDAKRIGLCGYSAGAAFSLPVCYGDERIAAVAAVSPPLDMFDSSCIARCKKPMLLISGGHDDFTPAKRFIDFCENLSGSVEHELIESADHFWGGYEAELSARVAAFFVGTLAVQKSI